MTLSEYSAKPAFTPQISVICVLFHETRLFNFVAR